MLKKCGRLADVRNGEEDQRRIRIGLQAAIRVVDIDVGFSSLIFRFLPLCRGPLVIECCLSSRRIVKDKTVTAFPGWRTESAMLRTVVRKVVRKRFRRNSQGSNLRAIDAIEPGRDVV